jgi:hypothetical protein
MKNVLLAAFKFRQGRKLCELVCIHKICDATIRVLHSFLVCVFIDYCT